MRGTIGVFVFLMIPCFCHAQAQQPHVDEIVKKYDNNGDGGLSKQEVAASRRYSAQFSRWDANRDGKVSRQEIITFRARFGIAADGTRLAPGQSGNDKKTSSTSFSIPEVADLARVDRTNRPPRAKASNSEFVLKTRRHPVEGDKYFILTDHTHDSYLNSLERLAKHHGGEIIQVKDLAVLHETEARFNSVRERLRANQKSSGAKYVAIAPRIETFRENMVLGIWELLSTLDEDPQIDCFPGFLVASSEGSFAKLIDQSIGHEPITTNELRPFAINQVQNSSETRSLQKSGILRKHFQKAGLDTPIVAIYGPTADDAPRLDGEKVWNLVLPSKRKFIKQFPKDAQVEFAKANLVVMHGHGIPGMSCSVDVDGIPENFNGKILLSGSCFSASPSTSDLPKMGQAPGGYEVQQREAFVLRAIDNGAIVAFGHQRLSSGFPHLYPVLENWTDGQSVGQAYQQLVNALIELTGRKSGEFVIPDDQKGQRRIPQNGLLYIVIGDPALQPMEHQSLLK